MGATVNLIKINVPPAFYFLTKPCRYLVVYGGRGSGKSWSIIRVLLTMAASNKLRILCTREFQTSIADSVYKLLVDQIITLKLENFFKILKTSIVSTCGSEFIFKGISHNIQEIKSLEGIDLVFCEEAQAMSEESWKVLIPTIRKENSRFFISFNTGEESDPTYQRFVVNPPPDCISKLINYDKNPYFPEVLRKEMEYCKMVDPEAYAHIWEGELLKINEAIIFRGKFEEKEFEAPYGTKFYYGGDWGFSSDPTVLLRCFIMDNDLYIDHGVHGVGVELDEIPQLFDAVPGSRDNLIKADSARPETISHVRRKGFPIEACKKWNGSIQDGISHLKSYRKIYVHPRCKFVLNEFQHYSYKKDPRTGEVLPIVIDKFNHAIDSLRYALEDRIQGEIDWELVVNS